MQIMQPSCPTCAIIILNSILYWQSLTLFLICWDMSLEYQTKINPTESRFQIISFTRTRQEDRVLPRLSHTHLFHSSWGRKHQNEYHVMNIGLFRKLVLRYNLKHFFITFQSCTNHVSYQSMIHIAQNGTTPPPPSSLRASSNLEQSACSSGEQ